MLAFLLSISFTKVIATIWLIAAALAFVFTHILNRSYAEIHARSSDPDRLFTVVVAMPFGVKPLLSTLNGRKTYDGRYVRAIDVALDEMLLQPDGLIVHERTLQDIAGRGICAERIAVVRSLGSPEFSVLARARASFPNAVVLKTIENQLAAIRDVFDIDSRSVDTDTLRITRLLFLVGGYATICVTALVVTYWLKK